MLVVWVLCLFGGVGVVGEGIVDVGVSIEGVMGLGTSVGGGGQGLPADYELFVLGRELAEGQPVPIGEQH